jgi:phosphoribosylformimino-5-aminoimidazole carboxamide ribotide isomerase
MELIPVLDLQGGVVVRARLGRRQDYRPITTPLSPTSDPVDVMRGLLTIHPFAAAYVADLDAIAGRGDHHAVLGELRARYAVSLWVDNGTADRAAAQRFLATGMGRLVIGSESQRDLGLVREFADDARVALSLDFRDDVFLGPPALLADPTLWPHRVIVMSLARVGAAAGPDLDRLCAIRAAAGPGRIIYAAGGVRDADDLAMLAQAGIAGALVASCLHDGRVTKQHLLALSSPMANTGSQA